MYVGTRYVLPGQDSSDWVHPYKGAGKYSNYHLFSSTQLLDGAPLRDHTPGTGYHPGNVKLSRAFLGLDVNDSPMYVQKFVHGGQSAPYLRYIDSLFHGLPGSEVFGGTWGHDGTREISTSRWSNLKHRGVPSAITLLGGRPPREYGEAIPNFGPIRPFIFQGVGPDKLEDSGQTLDEKPQGHQYAFQRVQEWQGVDSAKAL